MRRTCASAVLPVLCATGRNGRANCGGYVLFEAALIEEPSRMFIVLVIHPVRCVMRSLEVVLAAGKSVVTASVLFPGTMFWGNCGACGPYVGFGRRRNNQLICEFNRIEVASGLEWECGSSR